MLRVNGNTIVDDAGQPYQIKGISLIDVAELKENFRGKIDIAQHYWNINTIRLPVYPPAIPGRKSPYPYLPGNKLIENVLVPMIVYAEANDLNVIIDWHQIAPLNDETVTSAVDFWIEAMSVLDQYDNIIIEAYNEPTNGNGTPIWTSTAYESWDMCKPFIQDLVDNIRGLTDKLIICPTPAFCRLPIGASNSPLTGSNLAYTAHVYPADIWEQEGISPVMQANIDFNNDVLTQIKNSTVPLVLTEVGLNMDNTAFTSAFTQMMSEKPGLSWVAWTLDSKWWPPLLTEYNVPSRFGKVVKTLMA